MINYFKIFSKKFWWLYVAMVTLLIITVLVLCLIFKGSLNEFSGWASIVAGIMTYIGSSFLGVVVYYMSWVQQYKQEHVQYDISLNNKDGTKLWNYKEINNDLISWTYFGSLFIEDSDCLFVGLTIQNLNFMYPLQYKVLYAECVNIKNKDSVQFNDFVVASDRDYIVPLFTKETDNLYVGFYKSELKNFLKCKDFNIYLTMVFFNLMGSKEYLKIEINNDGFCTCKVDSEKKIKKLGVDPDFSLY